MKTKYGNIRLTDDGYYHITSRKEGNHGKSLHRVIWETHYKKSVPKGYEIHHINMDKLDNRIQNLVCVPRSTHMKYHNKHADKSTHEKWSRGKRGDNNARAVYTLWNPENINYSKYDMNRNGNNGFEPRRCFKFRFKGTYIPIGAFHDFVTVELINELVKKYADLEDI